jgi:hypothetical protein
MRTANKNILKAVLLVTALLTLSQPALASASSACQLSWKEENSTLYVDPSSLARFRVKNDEVAIRIEGAFGTNQSLYENLQNGQGIYLRAERTIENKDSNVLEKHTVLEVIAAKVKGRIIWTLGYQGDSGNVKDKVLLANNLTKGKNGFDCQLVNKDSSQKLALSDMRFPGVQFVADKVIEIPDASLVYSKLGL